MTSDNRLELARRMLAPPASCSWDDMLNHEDTWPPAILQMIDRPNPASSLTWTLEFPSIDETTLSQQANPWWQYRAHTDAAHNGYGHIAAEVWNENGKLVAISRQTVTVFA